MEKTHPSSTSFFQHNHPWTYWLAYFPSGFAYNIFFSNQLNHVPAKEVKPSGNAPGVTCLIMNPISRITLLCVWLNGLLNMQFSSQEVPPGKCGRGAAFWQDVYFYNQNLYDIISPILRIRVQKNQGTGLGRASVNIIPVKFWTLSVERFYYPKKKASIKEPRDDSVGDHWNCWTMQ